MRNFLTFTLFTALLFACKSGDESKGEEGGGSSAKGTTFEMSNSHTPLDKFEKKSVVAFKSGLNWNGKRYQPIIYLAISNEDEIKFNTTWANVEMPEEEGEVIILFKLAGVQFEKGAEPTDVEAGEFNVGEKVVGGDMELSCNVYMKGNAADLMMQNATSYKDFTGKATITNITKDLVEGTIELTGKDGTTVKVEFSEKIQHDFWESEFKGGKA